MSIVFLCFRVLISLDRGKAFGEYRAHLEDYMKKMIMAALLPLLALGACARSGDILATYDGGTVTRGEFYDWAAAQRIDLESMKKTKKMQESRLRMYTLEKLAALEAGKSGLAADPDEARNAAIGEENLLVRLYLEEELVPNAGVKEPVRKVSHIYVRVPNAPAKPEAGKPEAKDAADKAAQAASEEKIRKILAEINGGASFEDCAAKYTEDSLRRTKGDRGYILFDMMPEPYSKAAFALKKGEYTKEPVAVPGGFYLIKVADADTVSMSNVDKVMKDSPAVSRVKSSLFGKSVTACLDRLKKDADVSFDENAAAKGAADAKVFSVGDKSMTVKDLESFISFLRSRYAQKKDEVIPAEKKVQYARDAWELALLSRDAKKHKFDQNKVFLKKKTFFTQSTLARAYMRKIGKFEGTVPESQIRAEYDKNLQSRYVTTEQHGSKVSRKVVPYAEVRDRIRDGIAAKEEASKLDAWRKATVEKYHFSVNMKKLEGK